MKTVKFRCRFELYQSECITALIVSFLPMLYDYATKFTACLQRPTKCNYTFMCQCHVLYYTSGLRDASFHMILTGTVDNVELGDKRMIFVNVCLQPWPQWIPVQWDIKIYICVILHQVRSMELRTKRSSGGWFPLTVQDNARRIPTFIRLFRNQE